MFKISNESFGNPKGILNALNKSFAIIEFDVNGNVLSANKLFCQVMGYGEKEIVGQHHKIFVDSTETASPDYKKFWADLGQGIHSSGSFKRFNKAGEEVWIQATYNPVTSSSGKVLKVVKLASDITALKQREIEEFHKLESINRTQAIIEFEPNGTVLKANQNFCDALGYTLDEIVGEHHRMFVEDHYARGPEYVQFWEGLRTGEFVEGEFKRQRKNGDDLWIEASYNPIFDLDGNVVKVVKFARDITGRMDAVQQVGDRLKDLAECDLSNMIDAEFIPSFDSMRLDLNKSFSNLRSTFSGIRHQSQDVSNDVLEIRDAIDQLSKRTENQAASIEETSAAAEEVTQNVKSTVKLANEVGGLVFETKKEAVASGEIVSDAVEAMSMIQNSSDQIKNIISVIDDIAFQTNLLALNAGVEAARAGEAGKGFAVVAQEVRELAQKSATAAQEIKALITRSGGQVQSGVNLVAQTGDALKTIVSSVEVVSEKIEEINEASKEQSIGLQEINQSIHTLDRDIQQNASMAEEVTASTFALTGKAEELSAMIEKFNLTSNSVVPELKKVA